MQQIARGLLVAGLLAATACRFDDGPAAPDAGERLAAPDAPAAHPLDPLTADEIRAAVEILRAAGHADEDSRFPEFVLEEPPKADVLAWKPGAPFARKARVVVLDRKVPGTQSHEVLVDLTEGRVAGRRRIERGQPMILMEEYTIAADAVRADERWRAAITKRGVTNPDDVYIDVWAPGEVEGAGGARLCRAIAFHRKGQKSPYGPPIEGVVAVVDLTDGRVIDVADTGGPPVPVARTDFYDPAVTGPDRPRLPPLTTATPEGPGFSAATSGREIRWENWRMRVSFTQREGLVLHQVGWDAGGGVRPILYRASVSEMLVPYADPSDAWAWRSAFDEGEYGLGRLANQLVPGASVPEHARLLDVVLADDAGAPVVIPGAVALWERDAGFLWSHYDSEHGTAARRARELVVSFVSTIGNYDYACQWVFAQDGAVAFEAVLTGSLLTKAVASTECSSCDPGGASEEALAEQRFGTLVAANVLAPNHQHFVNVRMDLDVDGTANSVREWNVHGEPAGPANPHGNAFFASPTALATERGARRDPDGASHRTWEVLNDASRSAQGHPAGYVLHPGETSAMYLRPETLLHRRAAFAQRAFHVTRFRDGETYAAGSYTGQNAEPEGLARWADDDESLAGADVVAWYTVGVTHVPRPEEYPIMNATKVGFRLVPMGFFDRNPGLDVPAK